MERGKPIIGIYLNTSSHSQNNHKLAHTDTWRTMRSIERTAPVLFQITAKSLEGVTERTIARFSNSLKNDDINLCAWRKRATKFNSQHTEQNDVINKFKAVEKLTDKRTNIRTIEYITNEISEPWQTNNHAETEKYLNTYVHLENISFMLLVSATFHAGGRVEFIEMQLIKFWKWQTTFVSDPVLIFAFLFFLVFILCPNSEFFEIII